MNNVVLFWDPGCLCLKATNTQQPVDAILTALPITPGTEYYLTFDLNMGSSGNIQVDVSEAPGEVLTSKRYSSANGMWQRVTIPFLVTNPLVSLAEVKIWRLDDGMMGIMDFSIDNVELSSEGQTVNSSNALTFNTTLDLGGWTISGGGIETNYHAHDNRMEVYMSTSVGHISNTYNCFQNIENIFEMDIDRRQPYSNSMAVVLINPVTNAQLGYFVTSGGGPMHINIPFTPTSSTFEVRILNAGGYTLIDNIEVWYDRIVIHNVCDNSKDYRYGFNGMEKDNEVKGSGNSYDFGARIYDSRLGRWLSVDPKFQESPSWTGYNFGRNSPLVNVDPDGKKDIHYIALMMNGQTVATITLVTDKDNFKTISVANEFSHSSTDYVVKTDRIFVGAIDFGTGNMTSKLVNETITDYYHSKLSKYIQEDVLGGIKAPSMDGLDGIHMYVQGQNMSLLGMGREGKALHSSEMSAFLGALSRGAGKGVIKTPEALTKNNAVLELFDIMNKVMAGQGKAIEAVKTATDKATSAKDAAEAAKNTDQKKGIIESEKGHVCSDCKNRTISESNTTGQKEAGSNSGASKEE